MNQALAIGDIFQEVFQHLLKPDGSRDTRSLLSLAQVSRAFSECALSLLWRDLPRVLYLFRILPTGLAPNGGYDESKMYHRPHILTREATAQEWDRFWEYASRVRIIDASDVCFVHDSAWKAVSDEMTISAGQRGPLLPHLEEIRSMTMSSYFPLNALDHILVPTVRTMTLRGCYDVQVDLESFAHWHKLRSALSRLENLTTDHDEPVSIATDFTEFSFLEFTQLRYLHIGAIVITWNKMLALESFSNLRSLKLTIEGTTGHLNCPSHTSDKLPLVLPSLDTLILNSSVPELATTFCSCIACPRLEILQLQTGTFDGSEEGPREFRALVNLSSFLRVASQTLRVLDVRFGNGRSRSSRHHSPRTRCISDTIFTPLLGCDSLETLKLILPPTHPEEDHVPLYDNEMEKLVNAWPNVVKFMILVCDVERTSPTTPGLPPTIRTIAAFVQSHTHLTHLLLPHMCIPSGEVTDSRNAANTCPVLALDSLPAHAHCLKFCIFWDISIRGVDSPSDSEQVADSVGRATDQQRVDVPVPEFALMLDRMFPSVKGHANAHLARDRWNVTEATSHGSSVKYILQEIQAGRRTAHR